MTSLVMGWSRAPFLAHSTLVSVMDLALGKEGGRARLVYGHPTPQLCSDHHDSGFVARNWAYMDDFGSLCSTANTPKKTDEWTFTQKTLRQIKEQLHKCGLPVHKEFQREGILSLGAEAASSRPYQLAAVREKTIMILLATQHLLDMPIAPIKSLEKLVGLWGWILIFCRWAYPILGETYHFLQKHQLHMGWVLTPGVRAELETLVALAPLLTSNLELPWDSDAYMLDSSDIGYGVVKSSASLPELREEAQFCEMRSWAVCLEDNYSKLEEAQWTESPSEWSETVDDLAQAARPEPPLCPQARRSFRLLHLFSGYRRREDLEWWARVIADQLEINIEIFSIDLAINPKADLTNKDFLEKLSSLCREGFFHAIMAAPPCTTWSRARFNTSHPGPRPIRTRMEPWGRTDIFLTTSEAKKLFLGTELLLATLSLMKTVALAGSVALLEHPQDPRGPPFQSIWDTDIMKETCEEIDFADGNLDQCQYGQDARKATKIRMFGPYAALPESMTHLRRRCTHKTHKTELAGLDDKGNFKTSAAQTYPSRLCQALAQTFLEAFIFMKATASGPDPEGKLPAPPGLQYPAAAPQRARPETKRGARIPVPPQTTHWTRLSRWSLCYAGRWRKTEHTNIDETRVIVGLLRHLARSAKHLGTRALIFTDSTVALGALTKGRSSSPPLLRLCRQAAAVILAFEIRPLLRYVPSELNISDGPSRGLPIGVEPETVEAHRDRQAPEDELPEASAELLKLGRSCAGFSGG